MSFLDSRSILERMADFLHIRNDKDLGIALGKEINKSESAIRNWRSRNNLPFETVLEFAQKHNLSLDWLITGKTKDKKLDPLTEVLMTGFDKLDQDDKLKAVTFVGNLANEAYLSGHEVNQTVHGNGNNQQVFNGDVREVVGVRK